MNFITPEQLVFKRKIIAKLVADQKAKAVAEQKAKAVAEQVINVGDVKPKTFRFKHLL